jgi:hypothetical protein
MRMTKKLNREYLNGSNTKPDRPYMVQVRQQSQQIAGKRQITYMDVLDLDGFHHPLISLSAAFIHLKTHTQKSFDSLKYVLR